MSDREKKKPWNFIMGCNDLSSSDSDGEPRAKRSRAGGPPPATAQTPTRRINTSLMNPPGLSERTSVELVVVPLRDGLSSINRVYEALIDADVSPFSEQCSDYKHIREQIVQAEASLQQSEQATSAELKSLDESTEVLTRDMGRFEREMSDTKQTLENLKSEQKSSEKLQRECEGALQQARSNLNSTKDTLRRQEDRKRNAGIVTGVGAGLMLIPVFGWIAGPAMVIGGAIEIEEASQSIRTAEEEVRNSEAHVEKYRRKVSEYERKISETKSSIRQKDHEIAEIRGKIQKTKKQRETVAEFQSKVRRAVHILSVLSGKAHVVESQTRRFILQEPVMKVMEDLMKVVGDIAGNQLLSKEGIPKLIDRMRENNRRLAAICASSSRAEDENYC